MWKIRYRRLYVPIRFISALMHCITNHQPRTDPKASKRIHTHEKIAYICNKNVFQALRLAQMGISETSPGKLVNLLSNDVQRFASLSTWHPLWFSPITTIAASIILWNDIRWAGIIGVAIILAFIPIQSEFLFTRKF